MYTEAFRGKDAWWLQPNLKGFLAKEKVCVDREREGMLAVMNADEEDTGVLYSCNSSTHSPSSTQCFFSKNSPEPQVRWEPLPAEHSAWLGSAELALNPLFEDKPI